jgi:hypothetical protein
MNSFLGVNRFTRHRYGEALDLLVSETDESFAALLKHGTFELLDPRAAALNQKNKHGNKQNAGNNPNDHHTVHLASSFLNDWPP